jgi:hypothetical protein
MCVFPNFVISKAAILFLVNLPMVNIYKFYKKKILIQPPGEPREQHIGDVRQKRLSCTKFIKENTGRVDKCILAHF